MKEFAIKNQHVLRGHWNRLKARVRQKWGQLNDSDLAQFHGNVDELIGTIQQKTGESRETVESFLEGLAGGAETCVDQVVEAARQYAHEKVERGKDIVRDRPGEALAIFFGAGLVVGLVVALKRRK